VTWVGTGLASALGITGVLNIILSGLCIMYGLGRRVRIIRYVTIAMGVLLATASIMCGGLIGMILLGGWWHIVGLLSIMVTAVVGTGTSAIFWLVHKPLIHLGLVQDSFIDSQPMELDLL
jgi:hypothetical protein